VAGPGGEAEYGFKRRRGGIAVTKRFPHKIEGSIRNVSRVPPLKPGDKRLLQEYGRDPVDLIDELNTMRFGKLDRQRLKQARIRLSARVAVGQEM
jgi:hypothetical protein